MRVLLLGSTGLLGQAVGEEIRQRGWVLRDAARNGASLKLDIADETALLTMLNAENPDLVFNCAALVDVQKCEDDPGLAWRTNARPLAFLAGWVRRNGRRLVHVSTDHYWCDGGDRAHAEDEPVDLVNEYARTKYAGEALALSGPGVLCLRTSIVGIRGWERASFAEWAIETVLQDAPATLFADAYSSSIDVDAFAGAALDLAQQPVTGLFNLAASEVYSKERFVREVATQLGRSLSRATVGSVDRMEPRRPASLGLDVRRAERVLDRELPRLREVVASVLEQHRKRAS